MVNAPGFPGIPARWTSSAKDGVGTALSPRSTVWFTLSHGILNEIYYPCVDTACTRDLGLIITDGKPGGFFAEEKRDTRSTLRRQADGDSNHARGGQQRSQIHSHQLKRLQAGYGQDRRQSRGPDDSGQSFYLANPRQVAGVVFSNARHVIRDQAQ